MEVKKFENIIDEKSSELETLRKESHELLELNELMRKEVGYYSYLPATNE